MSAGSALGAGVSLGRALSAPSHVSTGAPPERDHSLRSSSQPITPEAKAGSRGTSASTRTPTTISTAMAPRNANTGLSNTAAPIMDNRAHAGRLMAYCSLTLTVHRADQQPVQAGPYWR